MGEYGFADSCSSSNYIGFGFVSIIIAFSFLLIFGLIQVIEFEVQYNNELNELDLDLNMKSGKKLGYKNMNSTYP